MEISPAAACAVLKNVYLGLRVIICELLWLVGEDRTFHWQLSRLEAQRHKLQCRLSELTVLADPERRELEADLALLVSDLNTLSQERAERHALHLRPVSKYFEG